MSDEIDIANDRAEADLQRAIAAARGEIKPGSEGDCDLCGEHTLRLICGVCASCRDKHGLV